MTTKTDFTLSDPPLADGDPDPNPDLDPDPALGPGPGPSLGPFPDTSGENDDDAAADVPADDMET